MERIQALTIVHQICEGTKHIHGAGHMHCDLKTDNVLLMENGSAKIADFGCAAPNASRALGHFRCVPSLLHLASLSMKIIVSSN